MTELKKHFAVIGNPIHHSLSPQIHRAFARENGLDIHYEAILSPLDQFKNTVHHTRHTKINWRKCHIAF
jgi:shikimate dehydrogenase